MSRVTNPVLDMELQPKEPVTAQLPATVTGSDPALTMIERFAADPNFDVAKLQALMDMREREMKRVAEQEFNQAMSQAQAQMRTVAPDKHNSQTTSDFASYAALDRMARPIYTACGFGLSFDSQESKIAEHVVVVCYVSHVGGYSRTYRADMPADGKGAKGGDVMTKTHATGSAFSYAQRYLLRLIFNLAVGGDAEEDDGNSAAGAATPDVERPAVPEGVHWIVRCEALGGRGKKAGNVTFSDGRTATVWASDQALFDRCKELRQAVTPVYRTWQEKGNYAPTLKSVKVYEFPSAPIAIDASEIPF
jgi:hypothetical protein